MLEKILVRNVSSYSLNAAMSMVPRAQKSPMQQPSPRPTVSASHIASSHREQLTLPFKPNRAVSGSIGIDYDAFAIR